jgi:hypothetical protein
MIVRLGIVWLEGQSALKAGHRLRGFVLDQERSAQAIVCLCEARLERRDSTTRIDRDLNAAGLGRIEKMKAVGPERFAGLPRERHSERLCDLYRGAGGSGRRGARRGSLALAFRRAPLFSVHDKEAKFVESRERDTIAT